jgi:hypothetical protein
MKIRCIESWDIFKEGEVFDADILPITNNKDDGHSWFVYHEKMKFFIYHDKYGSHVFDHKKNFEIIEE